MFQVMENLVSPLPSLLMGGCLHCQLDGQESATWRHPTRISRVNDYSIPFETFKDSLEVLNMVIRITTCDQYIINICIGKIKSSKYMKGVTIAVLGMSLGSTGI